MRRFSFGPCLSNRCFGADRPGRGRPRGLAEVTSPATFCDLGCRLLPLRGTPSKRATSAGKLDPLTDPGEQPVLSRLLNAFVFWFTSRPSRHPGVVYVV